MRLNRWAIFILLIIVGMAFAVTLRKGSTYAVQDRLQPLASSTGQHPAGTDSLGRDRCVRICFALLLSLSGAVLAALFATALATMVGVSASLEPRFARRAILLVCDVFLALPWLFLLMIVRSAAPLNLSPLASAIITFSVLAVLGWPAAARALERSASELRRSEWMLYSKANGLRGVQLLRSTVPNLKPLIFPQFLIALPGFVIAEANLGVIGLGIGEPLPSLGGMVAELSNSATLLSSPWAYLPLAMLVVILLLLQTTMVEP